MENLSKLDIMTSIEEFVREKVRKQEGILSRPAAIFFQLVAL